MVKGIIKRALWHYAKKYLKLNKPTVVGVVGSVGKTTTKQAVATILAAKYRVRMTSGNLNDLISVPFGVVGVEYPRNPKNILHWAKAFCCFSKKTKITDDTEILVLELGTDHPKDIERFGKYLRLDYAILTAIAPEHMEFFGTLDNVAREELSVVKYAKELIANTGSVPKKYLRGVKFVPYDKADFKVGHLLGEHTKQSVSAGVTLARILGLNKKEIAAGVKKVEPISGRMRVFQGKKDMVLIDDTYNSSPDSTIAALETLYAQKAPMRIAVLGQMNEMGDFSEAAHKKVARRIDARKLDLLVLLGDDAARFILPNLPIEGIAVALVETPIEAGEIVFEWAKLGTVVLLKGSQNGVFLEEATKILLKNESDEKLLVRQSESWLRKKRKLGVL